MFGRLLSGLVTTCRIQICSGILLPLLSTTHPLKDAEQTARFGGKAIVVDPGASLHEFARWQDCITINPEGLEGFTTGAERYHLTVPTAFIFGYFCHRFFLNRH
jgi:hypothetical protein